MCVYRQTDRRIHTHIQKEPRLQWATRRLNGFERSHPHSLITSCAVVVAAYVITRSNPRSSHFPSDSPWPLLPLDAKGSRDCRLIGTTHKVAPIVPIVTRVSDAVTGPTTDSSLVTSKPRSLRWCSIKRSSRIIRAAR